MLLLVRSMLRGQIITTMRDACNKGFLEWSSRLMLAMYSCDIQATSKYKIGYVLLQFMNESKESFFFLIMIHLILKMNYDDPLINLQLLLLLLLFQ